MCILHFLIMFVTSISQFMALNRPQEHGSNVQPPNHLTFVLKLEMQNAYKYLFIFRSFNHLTFTRPGLFFAVHQTCQFMNQSTQYHLIAAKSIFNRFCLGLSFALAHLLSLHLQTQISPRIPLINWRSTTGFVIFLGNTPVTWFAKR